MRCVLESCAKRREFIDRQFSGAKVGYKYTHTHSSYIYICTLCTSGTDRRLFDTKAPQRSVSQRNWELTHTHTHNMRLDVYVKTCVCTHKESTYKLHFTALGAHAGKTGEFSLCALCAKCANTAVKELKRSALLSFCGWVRGQIFLPLDVTDGFLVFVNAKLGRNFVTRPFLLALGPLYLINGLELASEDT